MLQACLPLESGRKKQFTLFSLFPSTSYSVSPYNSHPDSFHHTHPYIHSHPHATPLHTPTVTLTLTLLPVTLWYSYQPSSHSLPPSHSLSPLHSLPPSPQSHHHTHSHSHLTPTITLTPTLPSLPQESAVVFVENADHSSLSISLEDFTRYKHTVWVHSLLDAALCFHWSAFRIALFEFQSYGNYVSSKVVYSTAQSCLLLCCWGHCPIMNLINEWITKIN